MTFERVTVVIPVFNEEATIADCIAAVAAQDIGPGRLEVVVVDGGSQDATRARAAGALAASGFGAARVVVDTVGSRPANLNTGLAAASGALVCRVDARSRIPSHYVATAAQWLARRPDIAVVGGRQRALPTGSGSRGLGIARALNNRWGMGGAAYRRASAPGPADTVYLGVFRTAQLRAAGGWNERLEVNEDFDLARRMGAHGTVWFDPALEVGYVSRSSMRAIAGQYLGFGRGKVRYWRLSGDRPRVRQLAAVAGLPLGLAVAAPIVAVGVGWYGLAAALGVAAAVELGGAEGPRAGVAGHVVAAATLAVADVAWVAGVWAELCARPSRSVRRRSGGPAPASASR